MEESKAEKKEELTKSRLHLDAKLETISEVDASKEETKHFQIKKDGYNFPKIDNNNNTINIEFTRLHIS